MRKNIIPSSTIQEIKSNIKLEDVVRRYIALNVHHKALCPFHDDRSPSFSINKKKQFWKCFGCGRSGDVISFVQQIEQVSFVDAVKLLASEAGIALPKSERFKRYISRKWKAKQKRLNQIDSSRFYFHQAYLNKQDELRSLRNKLPIKGVWDAWDARDYLEEQLIDYRFDLLDIKMKKNFDDLRLEEAKIRNE